MRRDFRSSSEAVPDPAQRILRFSSCYAQINNKGVQESVSREKERERNGGREKRREERPRKGERRAKGVGNERV